MIFARNLVIGLCLALLLAMTWAQFRDSTSPDLMATMIAGHFWAEGRTDQIYALPVDGIFRMLPPDAWRDWLIGRGYQGHIYPYIYPPLWLPFGAWLDARASFETVSLVGHIINPVLLWASFLLALRAAGAGARLNLYLMVMTALAITSTSMLAALAGNQPQVLVAFLTVLAIERDRAGRPALAGAVLAIAAAIKIYPALLALIWLAAKRWRATTSFAVAGAILGLASIAVAGWPLHLTFLDQLSRISQSVLINRHSASFDSFLARQLYGASLEPILSTASTTYDQVQSSWYLLVKPLSLRLVDLVLLGSGLAVSAWLAARSKGRDVLVWPFAMTLLSLASPLSWTYHYIAPLAFFPALIGRLTPAVVVLVGLAIFLPTSLFASFIDPRHFTPFDFSVPGYAVYAVSLLAVIVARPHSAMKSPVSK